MRLPKLLTTLFICLFVYLFICLLPTAAHAQYNNPYITPNTDTNVPANLHTYTQSLVLEVLSAMTCQIIGQDPLTQTHQCLGADTTTGKIGYVPSSGGAIGFVTNMIASLYTPPVNTAGYMQYVASNFGLTKHAYADTKNGIGVSGCGTNGCGFDKLTPLLGLWTTFRNITYAAFVLVFIAIGFAIMLRVQIDPRTVMTIENQIPKIIIALILVTFSYAISGFLIDMMYATTYLTINVVTSSQGISQDTADSIHTAEKNDLAGGNPLGFMNDVLAKPVSSGNVAGQSTNATGGGLGAIVFGVGGSVRDIVQSLFYQADTSSKDKTDTTGSAISSGITGGVLAGLACLGVTAIFTLGTAAWVCPVVALGGAAAGAGTAIVGGMDLPTLVTNIAGNLIGDIGGLLALLVVAIAILVAMFRVWFTLILTYVNILLEIVLAPFFIIIGVFPGSKVGFTSWLKSMVGNLLAFPVTVAMFILAKVFMDNFAANSTNIFVPPLIGNVNGAVGSGQSPVAYIIALGMILLTPNVVQLTRGLVGAGDNKVLAGVFQGIGVGTKVTGGIFKRTTGAIFGEQITYDDNGTPKKINNPVEKLWRGFTGGH